MKILVLSDIHANLTALQAVLDQADNVDRVWCLGDIVGYGPDPNQCVEAVRQLPEVVCLRGNHDSAVCGLVSKSNFNYKAQEVLYWTEAELKEANRKFLASLPAKRELERVTIAHGSPRRPTWEYIMDTATAEENFDHFETEYCLVGHSHLPVMYLQREGRQAVEVSHLAAGEQRELIPKTIVNPGSVGQPRDRDPRAAYAVYHEETNTWTQHRVDYDIAAVQARMQQAELPGDYIRRLEMGW